MKFLDGLNDNFKQAKGNILMMNPLPSLEQAFSLIAQDEKQRDLHETKCESENSIALSSSFSRGSRKFNSKGRTKKSPNTNSNMSGIKKKQQPKCTNCAKLVHTRAKCWWIIGFPCGEVNRNQDSHNSIVASSSINTPDQKHKNNQHTEDSSVFGLSNKQLEELVSFLD